MQYMTLKKLQTNLETEFIRVSEDREPLAVALDENRKVVVVDMDDYNSLMETFYLLSNPVNAGRLREGVQQYQNGQRKEIDVTAYLD